MEIPRKNVKSGTFSQVKFSISLLNKPPMWLVLSFRTGVLHFFECRSLGDYGGKARFPLSTWSAQFCTQIQDSPNLSTDP